MIHYSSRIQNTNYCHHSFYLRGRNVMILLYPLTADLSDLAEVLNKNKNDQLRYHLSYTKYARMKRPRASDRESSPLSATSQADPTLAKGESEENTCAEKATRTSITVGLRVHEWGLNPLFWVSHALCNGQGAVCASFTTPRGYYWCR